MAYLLTVDIGELTLGSLHRLWNMSLAPFQFFTVNSMVESNISSKEKKSIKKVQVGKDQEKAQSEKDSHSKNRGGKKPN